MIYNCFEELNRAYGMTRERMSTEMESRYVKDCFDTYENIGFRKRFHSPYENEKQYNGMEFTVIGRAPHDEYMDMRSLPMWRISFSNGESIDAYPEEVCKIPCNIIYGHS